MMIADMPSTTLLKESVITFTNSSGAVTMEKVNMLEGQQILRTTSPLSLEELPI